MDISVLAKGDMLRSIKPTDNDKEDDIENNLLLPHGITERVMARYYFRVFYAEGLPKMSSDTVGKIKSVIKGENRDLIDPYVEISFAGQKRRTSTEHTYEAQWNEMLQFTELFPALCQRVQVHNISIMLFFLSDLSDPSSKRWDARQRHCYSLSGHVKDLQSRR